MAVRQYDVRIGGFAGGAVFASEKDAAPRVVGGIRNDGGQRAATANPGEEAVDNGSCSERGRLPALSRSALGDNYDTIRVRKYLCRQTARTGETASGRLGFAPPPLTGPRSISSETESRNIALLREHKKERASATSSQRDRPSSSTYANQLCQSADRHQAAPR